MGERLLNLSAWRNKDQLLRFSGSRCGICGKVSFTDRPCYHSVEAHDSSQSESDEKQDQSSDGNERDEDDNRHAA